MQHALHEKEVAREGADVGIVAGFSRCGELDDFLGIGLHELGEGDDVGLGRHCR